MGRATRALIAATLNSSKPSHRASDLAVALAIVHEISTWSRLSDKLSRARLAELTGLHRDTVSGSLRRLAAADAIEYAPVRGRRRVGTIALPTVVDDVAPATAPPAPRLPLPSEQLAPAAPAAEPTNSRQAPAEHEPRQERRGAVAELLEACFAVAGCAAPRGKLLQSCQEAAEPLVAAGWDPQHVAREAITDHPQPWAPQREPARLLAHRLRELVGVSPSRSSRGNPVAPVALAPAPAGDAQEQADKAAEVARQDALIDALDTDTRRQLEAELPGWARTPGTRTYRGAMRERVERLRQEPTSNQATPPAETPPAPRSARLATLVETLGDTLSQPLDQRALPGQDPSKILEIYA